MLSYRRWIYQCSIISPLLKFLLSIINAHASYCTILSGRTGLTFTALITQHWQVLVVDNNKARKILHLIFILYMFLCTTVTVPQCTLIFHKVLWYYTFFSFKQHIMSAPHCMGGFLCFLLQPVFQCCISVLQCVSIQRQLTRFICLCAHCAWWVKVVLSLMWKYEWVYQPFWTLRC